MIERVPYNYIPAPPKDNRERLEMWRQKYNRVQPYLLDLPNETAKAKESNHGNQPV